MLSSFIVQLAFVTELVLGVPAAGSAANSVVVAQSGPSQLAQSSDRAQREVSAARAKVRRLAGVQRKLKRAYQSQLAELDSLSRQRASWNRDRKISKKKAASQVTAKRLNAAARSMRSARAQLKSANKRLLAALNRELSPASTDSVEVVTASSPPSSNARYQRLVKIRNQLRRSLRPKPKKIRVPDIEIDPSDDPDDLEEKAQLLRRIEAELVAEEKQLARRGAYYSRQEKLRIQRARANEIDRAEGSTIRRNPTGVGASSPLNENDGADIQEGGDDSGGVGTDADGDFNSDPDAGGGLNTRDASLEASSVILADVVDDVTVGDLRRASRSTNPATRARAARRARAQVKARLERLRRTRKAIQRRAKTLRSK